MSSENIYTQKIKNKYKKHNGYEYVPYVYLVKCIPTGKVYYGSRFSKYAHPDFFFVDYFTSSKIVHEMIQSYGIENFQFEIRKTFKTREDCIKWEKTVLRRMKVSKHDKFINIDDNQTPHDNRNTVVISNPSTLKCIRIKNTSEILPGWIKGNINFINPSIKKRRWFHDPITGESFHVPENEKQPTWVSGRGTTYTSNSVTLKDKNLSWITNGVVNKLFSMNEIIPDGWYKGVTRKEEFLYKMKEINGKRRGLIRINDGNNLLWHDPKTPIPEGYVKGDHTRIDMGRKHQKILKEYINMETKEVHLFEKNPDSSKYITKNRYESTLPDKNKFYRFVKIDTHESLYVKGSEFDTVPDNFVLDSRKISEFEYVYINNNNEITVIHPKDLKIPSGWELGNLKLKGRIPHNKKI